MKGFGRLDFLFTVAFGLVIGFWATTIIEHLIADHRRGGQVVKVRVHWMSAQEVHDTCVKKGGRPKEGHVIVGCYVPADRSMIVRQPSGWDDHEGLEDLGHEFWHAAGAVHP